MEIDVAVRADSLPVKEIWSNSDQDLYVLFSPLRPVLLHLESDEKLLYSGLMRPGMLRLRAPGEKLYARMQSPSRNLLLTIPGSDFRCMFETVADHHRIGSSDFIEPSLRPDKRIHSLSLAMLSATTLPKPERQLFIDGLTRSLLALLVTKHKEMGTGPRPSTKGLSARKLSQSMEYGRAHLSQPLTLDVWASVVDLSAGEFIRRFHKTTGRSPYAWLLERRIDRSKVLLADETLSLTEVSLRVGFCSQSHFGAAFRQHTGDSPGRWRQKCGMKRSERFFRKSES